MPKATTKFVCQSCGYEAPRWMGRCPDCGQWASLTEETVAAPAPGRGGARSAGAGQPPARLADVPVDADERVSTGLEELDRVLGGGLVPGSLVLIGGDPGIGKSTLLMQVSGRLAAAGMPVLYISGEESARQVRMRSDRLGVKAQDVYYSCETDVSLLEGLVEKAGAQAIVVDSIQTMLDPSSPSAPGTVSQVRGATQVIASVAKSRGLPAFLVGHVTKEGAIAGPRVLEHMVDTVLYFEGDRDNVYRVLRAVKNRFGATDEVGVFEMHSGGLQEVANPSALFLAERDEAASGSVVCPVIEGTRPLLVEIQALAAPTYFPAPRRMSTGLDYNRFILILAVLEKRAGLGLGKSDVYANVTGGLRIPEPASDLAAAVAVASSARDIAVAAGTAVFGEIGLGGEVRGVPQADRRVREAERLGFQRVILPRRDAACVKDAGLRLAPVSTLAEAIRAAFTEQS